ncbi:retrovirus-related Pol polyprotein from transposon opus [Trichonephila clavipes]|nr:retrovirus-related Pol polyprotein from transposon opus [Trichonephila clavipes]
MLRYGTICPINSPYASPVVLTRKKNDLSPDYPEAYRFVIDYRKLNGITKYPRYPLPFNLFTDASGVGIGAVLQQNQKLIAFASRTLNKAERLYTVTERECLAVIWALNKFKTYFGPLPVKVITDHAALTKLTNGKNLSSRMIRWSLKLSEFNIEWEHKPGVQNVVADLLSRNPVDSVEGSQISCAALRALAINSREQFIREQREDPELGHIYRYLENPDDGSVNATICEGKDLETRFYASQQRQNQEPTDFVYDLLKLNKKLELGMSDKALVDHIFVRLDPQVQDYVEVRNPQTAIQLLEVFCKV